MPRLCFFRENFRSSREILKFFQFLGKKSRENCRKIVGKSLGNSPRSPNGLEPPMIPLIPLFMPFKPLRWMCCVRSLLKLSAGWTWVGPLAFSRSDDMSGRRRSH
jgi:hypothetical protein